jgi:hypothetical protein
MFCRLEQDEKTYNYLKIFVKKLHEAHCTEEVSELDKNIQNEEIYTHLRLNGFSQKDTAEIINWIKNYAQKFRDYLNTIKIAALIWDAINLSIEKEPTWGDFCSLSEKINSHSICLEAIHY